MKQIFTCLLGVSLLLISCSKEAHNETTPPAPQTIQATVSAGQAYTLNLGTGITASIQTQALHHQQSEIATAPNGNTVYTYVAGKGYAGADAVTLQQAFTTTASSGSGCYGNATTSQTTTVYKTIAIKFNVAN